VVWRQRQIKSNYFMTYPRFSELWDALVTNRPKPADAAPISNGMKKATADALIAYGNGDKSKVNAVRVKLGRAEVN
jgi:hypothetical protein